MFLIVTVYQPQPQSTHVCHVFMYALLSKFMTFSLEVTVTEMHAKVHISLTNYLNYN